MSSSKYEHCVKRRHTFTLYSVFAHADTRDCLFMLFGTIGAAITGFTMPAFHVLFGEMMDSLNRSGSNFQHEVNKIAAILGVVAGVNLISGMIQVCNSVLANFLLRILQGVLLVLYGRAPVASIA